MTVVQGLGETRRLSRRPLSKRRTPVASSRTRTIAACPASLDEMRLKTKSDFNLTRLQANTYLVDTRCVSSAPRSSGEVHCGAMCLGAGRHLEVRFKSVPYGRRVAETDQACGAILVEEYVTLSNGKDTVLHTKSNS